MNSSLERRRILVTRPEHQAEELVELLRSRGALTTSVPVMRLVPLLQPEQLAELGRGIAAARWDDVVFTSANAVGMVLPPPPAAGPRARIFAIGPGTAAAVARMGWPVEPLPKTFVAESLAATMLTRGVSGHRVLLPRAAEARPVLPQLLERAGAELETVALYRTEPEEESREPLREALSDPLLDCIVFTSGSSVECFQSLQGGLPLPPSVMVACIGPITASAARAAGLEPGLIAREHSLPGLLAALEVHLGPLPENGRQA